MLRAALAALVLSGCATPSPDAMSVRWVRVDQEEIHRVCAQEHGHAAIVIGKYRGCTRFSREARVCTIWAVDFALTERERMATLGHELKHCFDGPWH